jgi:hypothetical protein
MSLFKNAGSNRKYTDFYYLFRKIVNDSYEEHEKEPSAEFRACDVVNYYEEEIQDGNTSLRTIQHLTIETPSTIIFNTGDKIQNKKDNTNWRIKKITINDDNNGKDKSLRPKQKTILELEG